MTDRQLIEDLLSALEYHTEQTRPIEFSRVAIEAAREYLRKPAQRTWVGLNDTDLAVCGNEDDVLLARYWERVCREKNT